MSSELVPNVVEISTQKSRADSPPVSRTSHAEQRLDLLHQVSLLVLRSNDIQSAIPNVARLIRDVFQLDTVGIVLHDNGWVIQGDHEAESLPPAFNPGVTPIGDMTRNRDSSPAARMRWNDDRVEADPSGSTHRVELFANDEPAGFIFIRGVDHVPSDNLMIELLRKVGEILVEASERRPEPVKQPEINAEFAGIRPLLDIVSHLATLTGIDSDIQSLLSDIARMLDADLVSLVASDPTQPELFMSDLTWQTTPDKAMQRLIAAPAVRRAVDTRQSQTGEIGSRFGRAGQPSSVLALPLVARDESVGVLAIERDDDNPFVFSDREAAEIVADHLSYSLERVRRVRGYSRQNMLLSLVERVTAFIARSTDDDDLLARMAREIRRTFGYDCSIALIVGNRLVFRALELGSQEVVPDWLDEGIPLEAGVMGRVARTGQPAFVRNVQTDSSFLDIGRNTVSEIAMPIRSGDEVVGVMNVESGVDNPLQDLDFEILLILANHIGIALSNRQLIAAERESRVAIEAIQRVSTIVAEALDPEESLRLMADTLADTLGYPVVSLALLEGRRLIRKAHHGYDTGENPGIMDVGKGISGRVARSGTPVFLEDVNTDSEYVRQREDLTSEVCVPIRCGDEIVGVLNVEGNQERPVTKRDLHLLTTFAEHAGVLLNNARAYARLSREATVDPMTGVPNLRYFQQELHERFKQAQRDDQKLSLAVIDLDDLKEINDTSGHLVGDEVLRELAGRMKAQLREDDLLARYAGDEFVAIFPAVDEERAMEIAERLLNAARCRPYKTDAGVEINLSLSIGVASYPSDAESSTGLLRAADMAMYVAKESGKNRVSSAGQSEHIRQRSNG